MTKVILQGIGQYDLMHKGQFKDAGTPIELTPKEFKVYENLIEWIFDKDGNRIKYEQTKKPKKEKYTEEYLETRSFAQLKNIGKKFNVTDRSSKTLIKEILEAQK